VCVVVVVVVVVVSHSAHAHSIGIRSGRRWSASGNTIVATLMQSEAWRYLGNSPISDIGFFPLRHVYYEFG
jgi:hypothetical protein